MIKWLIANVICSYVGTITFAVLFRVPKRFFNSCGIIGTLGWLVYCGMVNFVSAPMASFCGTFVVVLISRLLTVPKKCPITMFLIPGIFCLIPGASVYYMAYNLVIGDTKEAGSMGFMALKIAFGIVFGIVSVISIPKEIFDRDRWIKPGDLKKLAKTRKREIERENRQ